MTQQELIAILNNYQITYAKLAELLDVSYRTVSNLLSKKKNNTKISDKYARIIQNYVEKKENGLIEDGIDEEPLFERNDLEIGQSLKDYYRQVIDRFNSGKITDVIVWLYSKYEPCSGEIIDFKKNKVEHKVIELFFDTFKASALDRFKEKETSKEEACQLFKRIYEDIKNIKKSNEYDEKYKNLVIRIYSKSSGYLISKDIDEKRGKKDYFKYEEWDSELKNIQKELNNEPCGVIYNKLLSQTLWNRLDLVTAEILLNNNGDKLKEIAKDIYDKLCKLDGKIRTDRKIKTDPDVFSFSKNYPDVFLFQKSKIVTSK